MKLRTQAANFSSLWSTFNDRFSSMMGRRTVHASAMKGVGDKKMASFLKEAHKMEEQGDRKSGQQAADVYEKAVNKFSEACEGGAEGEDEVEAVMGKGDCYQKWAGALLEKSKDMSNEELTIEVERKVQKRAEALYQCATDCYKMINMDASQQDFNACVNCGNTLANWSELCQPKEAVRLLHDAVLQYNAALQLDREDNEVWQNLGDALIQLGKNLCESDRQHEGEECFREAIDAYSQSCGLSDSRKGDDLPGLLENWGIGLVTASKCVEDFGVKEEYANGAVKRLKDAATFYQSESSPYCGIGDAYLAKSEVETAENALQTLQLALVEGYDEALRLEHGCVEAVLGSSEVHMRTGQLLAGIGDHENARLNCMKSADVLGHALSTPEALGGFYDRSLVQYNYACACALCGGRDRVVQSVLRRLLRTHGCTVEDLLTDKDFNSVRDKDWFQQLIHTARAMTD